MAYDDQDDLTKWLQSQEAPNLTPQAPAAEGGGPGVWSKAREMMDRQAAMQYQPQDYSKYLGKSEPAPDRMGHDFRTILAMALDLFGNKGRGAGQLMAAGNQTFDAKEAAWKRENGPQAMLARQMQVKQLEGADRAQFNQDRAQLGAQIGQEVQLAGAQQAQGNADRTFQRQEERDMAADVQHQMDKEQQAEQFAAGQGLTREQMAQSKALQEQQMRQSAAQAAAARAQSDRHFAAQQEQHLLDQDNQLNRDRDAQAHARAMQGANFSHDDAQQAARLQTQKDIHDLTHPAPVAPKGYRVAQGQDAQFRQSMGSPAVMKSILDQAGNAEQIQSTLDELQRLRNAPSSASNKKLYDAAIKSLIGDRSQEGSTGVLSGTEFERYLADLPEYGSIGNMSTWRGARDVMMGRDPAAETLEGIKTRYRDSNLSKFKPYGLEYDEPAQQDDPIISRYGGRLK